MRTPRPFFLSLCLAPLLIATAFAQSAPGWSFVERTLGRAGKLQDGVYKVAFPRTDLHVRMGRTPVLPAAALGSWMAFRQNDAGTGVVADGDLVLLEPEVNGVISALVEHDIEVSAVHNHLTGEQPEVLYVHFFARGELGKVAQGLKAALDATATPTGPATPSKAALTFDQKSIEEILGKPGTVNGAVLAFSFPRHHAIAMHGATLPPAMGMATAINFQPSPAGVAATGDFVLREAEANPVITALRAGGVKVTAVHNHLLDDNPHAVFVHFWAEGKADAVAKALREALNRLQ
ncbi:MAG TPA: DUF1259 domain-containing protein [Terriglobales bacterium]|nr:DUF1259 domain-containing protein [Terriglobales bacterium]